MGFQTSIFTLPHFFCSKNVLFLHFITSPHLSLIIATLKTFTTSASHILNCYSYFSRVESFIEHQDACSMGRIRSDPHPTPACLSQTASSPSSQTNLSAAPWQALPKPNESIFLTSMQEACGGSRSPNLQLQLLTTSTKLDDDHSTQLQLSIGSPEINARCSRSQLQIAVADKTYAEETRQMARRQMEAAEHELANAKRIRQAAQAELQKAQALRDHSTKNINAAMVEITCHSCKSKFQQALFAGSSSSRDDSVSNSSSVGLKFISSALRDWEVKKSHQ